jgi:hypothetical protein
LLLVISHLFAVPVLVLWVRLGKSKELKLGCEKYFCGVTYWAPLEMLSLRLVRVTPVNEKPENMSDKELPDVWSLRGDNDAESPSN